MLRATRAELLALLTAGLVVLLAALFAWLRNTQAPAPRAAEGPAAAAPAAVDATRLEASRRAFDRLGCSMCHAIGGHGNPASPLDGIGGRMDAAAIRDWAIAAGSAREQLPPSVARRKARAADDPELDALVDDLARAR